MGSVMAAVNGVIRGRNETKFQTFLEEIGKPLAFGNVDAVVDHIAENIEEPWMADGLERGWKTAQETLDPLARRCLYLMVADYMSAKRSPDRFHRQFGNLFMESDASILRLMWRIAQVAMSFQLRLFFISESRKEHGEAAERFYDMQDYGTGCVQFEDITLSSSSPLYDACDVLQRNGFLSPHQGTFGMTHARKEFGVFGVLGVTTKNQCPLWGRLYEYLSPVGATSDKCVGSRYTREVESRSARGSSIPGCSEASRVRSSRSRPAAALDTSCASRQNAPLWPHGTERRSNPRK